MSSTDSGAVSSPSVADRRVAVALGLLMLGVYLATAPLRFQSIDEVALFTVTRNLAARGTFRSDVLFWLEEAFGRESVVVQGVDGYVYSIKDVGPSILAVPLVWLARLSGVSPVRAALLFSPIVSAITAGLLYLIIRAWKYRVGVAVLGSLTFGLASMAWPYSGTLYTQPLAALGLLLAISGTVQAHTTGNWRPAIVAGLGLGLAGVSAAPTWISMPLYLLYLISWRQLLGREWRSAVRRAWRMMVAFGLAAGLIVVLQAIYNLARFGSPLQTGHQQTGVAVFRWLYLGIGSFGQLFSTPRGVLWYAPFVALIPWGAVLGWKSIHRPLLLMAGQVVTILFIYSSSIVWYGGLNWGPRFLVAVMPTLTLLTMPVLNRILQSGWRWERLIVAGIMFFSVATQLLASLFDPPQEAMITRALESFAPQSFVAILPIFTDINLLPLVRLLASMRDGQWNVYWMTSGQPDWLFVVAHIIMIALASVWLVLALRRQASHHMRNGLLMQAGLTVGLAALILFRYPQAPGTYSLALDSPKVSNLERLTDTLRAQAIPTDGIVTVLPYSYLSWLDLFDGGLSEVGLTFAEPLSDKAARKLAQALQRHSRIWLITEGTVAGNRANGAEQWLAERGFVGTEQSFGEYRLVMYSFSDDALPFQSSGQVFGEQRIELVGYASEVIESSGTTWLNVWLRWKTPSQLSEEYTVFVHLVDAAGIPVAQHDGWPAAAYAPTSSWVPGMSYDDRHSVLLTSSLPAGEYRLAVGLYHGPGNERLLLDNGSADALLLDVQDILPD